MSRHHFLSAVAALGAAAGCAPTLPQQPVPRALVRDVARVVDVRGKVGWLIDDIEIEAILPDAMKSACRVGDLHRSDALLWLDAEIARQGGPIEEAWAKKGKTFDDLDSLLLMSRTKLVLGRADAWVRGGKCPFWIEKEENFRGVHVGGSRFVLALEGGGRFIEEFSSGTIRYGGGGSGRLLVGYGFAENLSVFVGVEGGGGARFASPRLGQQTEIPDLVGIVALPIVARYHMGLSTHAELELGPMAYVNQLQLSADGQQIEGGYEPGVRLGVGFGASYLRLQRGVLPHFTFSIAIDYIPGRDGRPDVTQLSIGGRTGINYSP